MNKCELRAFIWIVERLEMQQNRGMDFHVVSEHLPNVTLGATYTANIGF